MEVGNLSVKIDFDLSDLKQGLKEIGTIANLAANMISRSFAEVGESLSENLTGPVIDAAQMLVRAFDKAEAAMGEGLATAAETAAQKLGEAFNGVEGTLDSKLTAPVRNAANDIGDEFSKAGKNLGSAFNSASNKARTTIVKMASDIVKAMSKLDKTLDKGSDSVGKLAVNMQGKGRSALGEFASGCLSVVASLADFGANIIGMGPLLTKLGYNIAVVAAKAASNAAINGYLAASSKLVGIAYKFEGLAAQAAVGSVSALVVISGIALAAFAALAVIIGSAVAVYKALTKRSRELKKETEEITKATEEHTKARQEEAAALTDEKMNVAQMVIRLGELRDGYDGSESSMNEMINIISQLNTIYPDLNLAINEQTGELNMEDAAMKKIISSEMKRKDVIAAQEALNTLYADQKDHLDQIAEITLEYGEGTTKTADMTETLNTELETINASIAQQEKFITNNVEALENYDECVIETVDTEELRNEALKEFQEDQELSISEHYAKIAELEDSADSDRDEKIKEHYKEILELQQEEQEKLEESRKEHINNMLGFDAEGAYESGLSFTQQLDSLKNYNSDMESWYHNLALLTAVGFDDIAEAFREKGPEAGGELENVIKEWQDNGYSSLNLMRDELTKGAEWAMTDTASEFEKIPGAVSGVLQSETDSGTGGSGNPTVATEAYNLGVQIPVEINEGLASQSEFISSSMAAIGKAYIDGIIQGLDDNYSSAVTKAEEVAGKVTEAIKEGWLVQSPSKVGINLSRNLIKGLEIGLNGDGLLQRSAHIADGVVNSMQSRMLGGNTTNYDNSRTLSTNVTVQSQGSDQLSIERMWRRLIRQQAVAIAR